MRIDTPSRRRRLVAVVGGMVLALGLAGIGLYGLITGPTGRQAPPDRRPSPAENPASSPAPREVLTWHSLPTLPDTSDPIRYANAVATSLFTWDTMSGLSPDDYTNPIVVEADPSGVETNGLLTDLDNYLPAEDVWLRLRDHETRQTLQIEHTYIPDTWTRIRETNPGRLDDGTVAVTITGTSHREGEWLGEPATSGHAVAFTIFLACPPAYDRCHTLRLSQPGTPLTGER